MVRAPSRKAAARGVAFAASPVLAVRLPAWRSRVALFLLFAAFVALAARAFWLQAVSTEFLQKKGASRYARTLDLPAVRGKILDRNGEVMATSLPVKAIWAVPDSVNAPPEKLQRLAQLLDISSQELKKKLESDSNFVYLKRQVEIEAVDQVLALDIPGIHTKPEYKRFYPAGQVAAHVLGFTSVEDKGQEGMELAQQSTLGGITGSRRVIRDNLGRVVDDIALLREPQDGRDLTLSIDSKIQYIAFTHLQQAIEKNKAKAGGIVVLDVKTGEVLALANMPTYNPNSRVGLTGAQLRNRVFTDTYEPGSTLKPFTVALALEKGLVTPNSMLDTPNKLTIGPSTIGDSHPHAAALSVSQIIQQSSNVGTVRMAQKLEPRQMWDMFSSVGFGQPPRVGFPGAVAGRMRPYKTWRPIEQATMSYGHGISVSLIQVARSYMIFARNGEMIPLSFQKVSQLPAPQRVISDKTAHQMRDMMELVVGPGGTAPLAQVRGYRVAGKTGTAHKLENGHYVNKYVASFVGLAPASDPRIIIAVMIDEPGAGKHFGGLVAAPLFASVAASTLSSLNVPPDASVSNVIMPAQPIAESM
ncbi:MAG: peptidoglycan D,D-transpeptidase FtsI family protein [Burkholderiaceae bacterium]|nr:penicillin-binding protein 2 [Polynucleobacter sp.]